MIPVGAPEVMCTLRATGAGFDRVGNAATEHETYIPMVGCIGGQHPNAATDTDKSPTLTNAMGAGGGHVPLINQPIPYDLHQVTAPVNRQAREPGDPCHTLAKQNAHNAGIVQPIAFHATQEPINGPLSPALGSNMYAGVAVDVYNQAIDGQTAATLTEACGGSNTSGPKVMQPIGLDEEQNAMIDAFGTLKARTLGGGFEGSVMQTNMAVRRLTPVECERLQGFPDNYTEIPWRGKAETPDGPRYKALGNSMAVPVMRWIGQRIQGR
jgi:hypothetical protein